MARFAVGTHLPPGSADGQVVVVDLQSDNEDVLVLVDPQEMLTDGNRQKLAKRIANALNAVAARTVFQPEYPE